MELMPAQTRQSYCQSGGGSLCAPLNLAVASLKKTVQKINELCNLPDLEITPVTGATNKRSVTESNERSTSMEAETSRESNLKEKSDMANLLKRLPVLNQYFHLHNKIGEGTFSTVYLATLKNSNSTKNYAVKHLTQNCQQLRIEGEFRCMTEIGGKDNVVHADYCLTSGDDCVTFIMPYLPHKKFSDYVLEMNADETRLYMKNLFIALRRVHSFNIIHRDVKPGNFLYNRETKQFLLVDFGLAQMIQNHGSDLNKEASSMVENMPIDYSKKRKRRESVSDKDRATPVKRSKRAALKPKDNNVKLSQVSDNFGNMHLNNGDASVADMGAELKSPVKQYPSKEAATPLKARSANPVTCPSTRRKKLFDGSSPGEKDAQRHSGHAAAATPPPQPQPQPPPPPSLRTRSFTPLIPCKSSSAGNFVQVRNSRVIRHCEILKSKPGELFQKPEPRTVSVSEVCSCSGRGAVCEVCSFRSKMVAPRAGTPGFRPPEVLFKYPYQTTAVDMWASGVILLCILSGCYPFFKSPNDLVALAEIMTVFGTEPINRIATKFGRRVIVSDKTKGVNLKKLCKRLRTRTTKKTASDKKSQGNMKCNDCLQLIMEDGCLCISEEEEEEDCAGDNDSAFMFPNSAFDLLKRLLDLDPTTRITAAEALEHPFILGR